MRGRLGGADAGATASGNLEAVEAVRAEKEAFEVSKEVGNVKNNSPELLIVGDEGAGAFAFQLPEAITSL